MISTDTSITSEEDETARNLGVLTSLQMIQEFPKSNYNHFYSLHSKTLSEYDFHLQRIKELLAQLQHETSDCEKCNISFQSSKKKSHPSSFQLYPELKASSFGKGKSHKNCKLFSNIKSTTNSKMLHSDDSNLNFPCQITSCVCGNKNERRNFRGRKITKIFPTFSVKENISRSSINKNSFDESSQSGSYSETNLENTLSSSCKCIESLNKTPINIQLTMNAAGDSNYPLTFMVEVPSTVLEILRKSDSKINNSEYISQLKKSKSPIPEKKSSLKSVFSKLLKNKTTKSCTSTSTLKSSSFVNSERFSADVEIQENSFKDVNSYSTFPDSTEFSQINITHRTSDVLNTEFCNSDIGKVNSDKIIEKQFHNDKFGNSYSKERKLTVDELYTNFLENQFQRELDKKLNSEKENASSCCSRCKMNLEIPINVKIRKRPLILKRSHHRRLKFKPTLYTHDKISSVVKTSSLEYLLQNLANVRKKEDSNLRQPAERDWHQTLSTRQLSKISLCSSGNCTCSVKDEYDSGVIEITEEIKNEKSDIKLSITAKLHRLTFNVFGR